MELSEIGRGLPNQVKVEARHYINELLATNQNAALSRRKQGFESPRERQGNQELR